MVSIPDLTGRICRDRLIFILRLSLIIENRQVMLQALVITLREGFEAFLIVAISLSYLRKSGRAALTSAVHWGIGVAVAVSALGGYLLFHSLNQEWLDGPLALVAAVSVGWMTIHMWRTGRRMKGDIEGRLQASTAKPGARGVRRRVSLHAADDQPGRHGNRAAAHAVAPDDVSRRLAPPSAASPPRESPGCGRGTVTASTWRCSSRPPRSSCSSSSCSWSSRARTKCQSSSTCRTARSSTAAPNPGDPTARSVTC